MNWISAGSLLLALAVGIGAFGAHGLRGRLDEYSMGVYEKAVFYHFVHAIGILLAGVLLKVQAVGEGAGTWSAALLLAGILLFSGSLYVLAVSGQRWLGAVTPFGGLCFIAGWLLLGFSAIRK